MSACSSILEDGDYDPTLDKSKMVTDMAARLKQLCVTPSTEVKMFCQWLKDVLKKIIDAAASKTVKVSSFKEGVWSRYHALRSSETFQSK